MARDIAKANRAIAEAWKKERELVEKGMGTRDWTREEQEDILATGKAHDANGKAFEGHHMQSVSFKPDNQGEAGNIQFLTRDEHLAAHRGSYQNKTNGYYNYRTGEMEPFKGDNFVPCERINLSYPVAIPHVEVLDSTEAKPEIEQPDKSTEKVETEQKTRTIDRQRMEEKPEDVEKKQNDGKKGDGEEIPVTSKPVKERKEPYPEPSSDSATTETIPRQNNNDNKATNSYNEKPHGVKQPEKKGWLARLGDAIRDKNRELLRREFYDEYGDYYDDPVEKYEAMRAHVDQHEGDSIIKCSFHVLRYGKRTYVDPFLENPMVQNAISQAVSLGVQRKLSDSISRNESTNADEVNKTRQGGKTPSSDKSAAPNAPKPDVPKPDSLPTPDSYVPGEGTGKGTPKSPHPRKGYEGYRIKRNDDGELERTKVPVKPTFIHPEQVETESNDDN